MGGWLDQLNNEQRRAATSGEGPVLIVAGPGTGKTKTLTARIAHLIQNGQVQPERVLALTFTKKAAEEMRNRVVNLLGSSGGGWPAWRDSQSAQRSEHVGGRLARQDPHMEASSLEPTIATFHALCHELLGSDTPFVTDAQRLQLIKSLSRPKELKGLSARELGLAISRAKNSLAIDDSAIATLVRGYNKALAGQGLRDFDDLLLDTYNWLHQDEQARAAQQKRFQYILVDEFQDTNRLQYELLRLLLGHDNLFVIGDPNQSIYGFRGASGTIFEQYRADFPAAAVITLTTNYRSVPAVVHLSNAIFPAALNLTAHVAEGGSVRAMRVLNEYSEAQWVLNEMQRAIGGGDFLKASSTDRRTDHRRLSDFAVLYRSRPAATTFQKLLAESGLPYQVVGDGSPYDRPQVQAILALLRAAYAGESLELEGYGSAQRRLLAEELDRINEAVPRALAEKIIGILGFEPSHDLQQFASVLVRFTTVPAALRYFDEIAEQGFYDPAADAITLLTIHAAKGLEFPHVFLLAAEEGILPSARGDEAEERRLLYVAVTRARNRLDIMHAKHRGGQQAELSRFIAGLPGEVLERHTDQDMEAQLRRIAKRAAKRSQTSLF
jgi:DNA helicase II / ATP-dependent DNA helicase PcrA